MEIRTVMRQETLAESFTTAVTDLPQIIGDVYGRIMAYMDQKGVGAAGYPYIIYFNMDMDALEVEVGFPVAERVKGNGTIEPSSIPGGRTLYAIHTGPYSTLENTYHKAMEYIEKERLEVLPWMYESYLNSPVDTPEDQLKTGICFPLA